MDINIRNSVKSNLKDSSTTDIYKTIEDAINVGEEKVLPGLGVLFEALWHQSDDAFKNNIVCKVTDYFK